METVQRYDAFEWRKDSLERTPQGYLKIEGYATRTGVFDYPTGKELRHPDEVLKQDSLSTLANVPVTLRHPPQMLNPKNTARYQKGYTGDRVDTEGDLITVSMIVTDETLIKQIERGDIQELSCGYTCQFDATPGEWEGQRYDGIQREIIYNHLAIVPKGRAGSRVRIKTDEVKFMIRIDGKEIESEEAIQMAVDALQSKVDTIQAKLDEAEAKAVQAQERIDAFESTLNDKVASLVALRTQAAAHLPKDFKFDGLTETQIKAAVIKARHDGFDSEGKSEDYINARFDAIIEAPEAPVSRVDSAIDNAGKVAKSGSFNPAEAARQAMMNRK